MGHLRNFIRALTPNPFLQVLKKLPQKASIAIFWNRGLGDIPLELKALINTIFEYIQEAKITIITREDLYQGFTLLDPRLTILTSRHLKRKATEDYDKIFKDLDLDKTSFDHIFYKPDPAYWVKKQKQGLEIKLKWNESFFKPLDIPSNKPKAFLHIHSETIYGFEKNLPKQSWDIIIADLKSKGYYTLALGFEKKDHFDVDLDLRGTTDLYQILSTMQEGSCLFIGPDSGLLNMLYYLDVQIKMHLISFWANTSVGLLKQGSCSANKHLKHDIIIANNQNLSTLNPSEITFCIPDVSALNYVYYKKIPSDLSFLTTPYLNLYKKLISIKPLETVLFKNIQNPLHTEILPPFYFSNTMCPIILAGGQGTRLNFHLPKALFKINGKTLLEHFIDKIKTASKVLNEPLEAILIVSQEGYKPITEYLKEHDFFGLDEKKFHILIQKSLPFLTVDNKLIMKDEKNLYEGPNGNGEIFHLIKNAGLFDLIDKKIKGFEIVPIDNPLAPIFLKNHEKAFDEGYQASILAIQTQQPQEKLGKICSHTEGISIIEYTQNPPSDLSIANTGLLAFERALANKLAEKTLPLHIALKEYHCFNGKNYEPVLTKKFETFIFDNLKWAKKIKIFTTSRSYIFQPLKEKIGPYGIEALEKALNHIHQSFTVDQ